MIALAYLETMEVIQAIERRLARLRREIAQQEIDAGRCPHPKPIEVSTMDSPRKQFMCPECGEVWEREWEAAALQAR